ncbi:hypothetical protein JW949_02385 [Candidatus Woesearchaeota archaeon]|nr:hypothetical protein [Candidatus Woesearchaeota archaeon]
MILTKIKKRNIIKNKKALAMTTLAIVIMASLSFLIISGVIVHTKNKAKLPEGFVCRMYLSAQEKAEETDKIPFFSYPFYGETYCETYKRYIPYKESKTGETDSDIDNYAEKEKIIEQIAEKIAISWWETLEGQKRNIFQDTVFNNNNCFLTYIIEVESTRKFPKEESINGEVLKEYLRWNPYTTLEEGDIKIQYTYMDYIQGWKEGEGRFVIGTIDEVKDYKSTETSLEIQPGQSYAILVISPTTSGGGKLLDFFNKYKEEPYNIIIFTEYDPIKLNDVCNVVIG